MLKPGSSLSPSHLRKCAAIALATIVLSLGSSQVAGAQSIPTIPALDPTTTTTPTDTSADNSGTTSTTVGPNAPSPANGPESGLTVSPALVDNTVNPGSTFTVPITIANITDRAVPIEVSKGKLETDQLSASAEASSQYDISPWFTIESGMNQLLLPQREQKTVNVTVNVPADAEPGGHYATVFFAALTADSAAGSAGQTLLNARVGVVFLLTVRGDVKAGATIDAIKTQTTQWDAGVTTFKFGIKNTGNVHYSPSGTLVVKDLFGRKVKELPLEQGVVLPGADKQYELTWERGIRPGIYTAEVSVAAGIDLKSHSKRFVIIPLVILIPILLILLVILLGVLGNLRRRERRRMRQHVIDVIKSPEPGEIIDGVEVPLEEPRSGDTGEVPKESPKDE